MKQKVILITGAGGYVGKHLAKELANDNTVIALGHGENNLRLLGKECRCIVEIGAIENADFVNRVFEKHRPDIVIHCAALKHVLTGEEQPLEAMDVNIVGTLNIFTAADLFNCEACIFVSTDKADRPINIYGKTKEIGEKMAKSFSKRSHCRYLTIRFCNIYGSTGSVVEIFSKQLAEHKPLVVTKNAARYFVMIDQVVQAILSLYEIGESGKIYLINNYVEKTIEEVAYEVARSFNIAPAELDITYQECVNSEKLKEDYSLSEEVSLLKI
jgi:FlaA1/EpsC-like NDP-sugar epimerase